MSVRESIPVTPAKRKCISPPIHQLLKRKYTSQSHLENTSQSHSENTSQSHSENTSHATT